MSARTQHLEDIMTGPFKVILLVESRSECLGGGVFDAVETLMLRSLWQVVCNKCVHGCDKERLHAGRESAFYRQ